MTSRNKKRPPPARGGHEYLFDWKGLYEKQKGLRTPEAFLQILIRKEGIVAPEGDMPNELHTCILTEPRSK